MLQGEPVIGIVKDNLDERVDGRTAGSFVQQGLPFFLSL
jgi:hypothetical protein